MNRERLSAAKQPTPSDLQNRGLQVQVLSPLLGEMPAFAGLSRLTSGLGRCGPRYVCSSQPRWSPAAYCLPWPGGLPPWPGALPECPGGLAP